MALCLSVHCLGISIHPPRVGRDRTIYRLVAPARDFNPPSPCGEGRGSCHDIHIDLSDFNPPSPCGEGLVVSAQFIADQKISIHPPRVGRDVSLIA